MARQKRLKSETGIYHVILRGINKQEVFINEEDYKLFLKALSKCKTISGFKLYAFCIMGNHIHLLIQEGKEPLDLVFKRFGDMFVYWYNNKYNRTGAVFQGRYKSIPVNDDEYFITVLKYIHQNPVKARITENCADYLYSSYNSYFLPYSLVDTDFALSLMSIDEFKRIHTEQVDEVQIFGKQKKHYNDNEAYEIILQVTCCKSLDDFKQMPKDMQKAYIKSFKTHGLSIRQICRLTGISQRTVQYS